MLESFVQSHPGVQFLDGLPDVKVVVRTQLDKTKVALVSGEQARDVCSSAALSLFSLVVRFLLYSIHLPLPQILSCRRRVWT